VLVAVGESSVDVAVALQQGVLDGLAHFIGLGLPGAQTDGGDLVAGVEGVGLPVGGFLLAINAGELLCIADILSVQVRHFGMIGFRCSYRREGGKRRLLYLTGQRLQHKVGRSKQGQH
jgi:hypothetical protein